MHLFYQPELSPELVAAQLTEEESRHATKVLRLEIGSTINLIDGKGGFYTGILGPSVGKKCAVKIENYTFYKRKNPLLRLAVAPTKNIDRFEWVLEKATELGVSHIIPLICDHSERTVIKPERLEKILISAAKQSQNFWTPILAESIKLDAFLKQNIPGDKFIAHCAAGKKEHFFNLLDSDKDSLVLIGPEGDFSAREIQLALSLGFKEVSLGENRLRTETAAIAAAHCMVLKNSI